LNSGFPSPALLEHVERRARDVAGFQKLGQRRLVDQPPRAQLMMRTPFLVLARFSADRMFAVFSVSGTCSVMKSALFQQLVQLDLGHARSPSRAPR
jgi:hypothetical protein